jgi:hemerythrin-like domain-containing protein
MTTPEMPTAQLVAEHDRILVLLEVIQRLAELAEEPAPPLKHMAQAIELVRGYADDLHHGKEEQLLFPRLEEAGMPPGGGPVACMRHEHEEGRAAVAMMDQALDELEAGQDGAGTSFARAAAAYVGLLRSHIDKENQVLFPMAEQMLSHEVKVELLRSFEAVEEHDVGEAELANMVKTLEALASEYLGRAPA